MYISNFIINNNLILSEVNVLNFSSLKIVPKKMKL
jgi:hypothetical protein